MTNEKKRINRLMLAGTGSGCGKTTVTCAVLRTLMNKGLKASAFKCGPDYIDPMFHSTVVGAKSRNLDLFMLGEKHLCYLFAKNSDGSDIAVIEGVMGFYDGLGMDSSNYSSSRISNITGTPVILVVDPHGMSLSVCAIIKGFLDFEKNNIQGVILNNTSKGMFEYYRKGIESVTGIQVIGYLPKLHEAVIESRHLGLVTAAEIDTLQNKIELLAKAAEQTVDLELLTRIAQSAPPLEYETPILPDKAVKPVRIAIARDRAFCFYYQDSLDLLTGLDAELIHFSPLEDACLPDSICGLILGGGYPELHARRLSENKGMLQSVRSAAVDGMPIYAECGGYMYLGETMRDMAGNEYPMAGVIGITSQMTDRLQNFGYHNLTANRDNILCEAGQSIPAHEFHYAQSSENGDAFQAVRAFSGKESGAMYATENILAGYPHLHLWANPSFAAGFIKSCGNYADRKERT